MLEELGLPYEAKPLDMGGAREHKSEAFLRKNPNGKVPVLVDGDFTIWESLAINHYLADRYRPEMLGRDARERGLVQQWSIWALAELQPPLVELIIQKLFMPPEKRSEAVIAKAREKLPPMLAVLDGELAGREQLVGGTFSLADLNVASVVNIAAAMEFDLKPFAAAQTWFDRIRERPSYRKLMSLRGP